jgi:hypothetical protein
MSIGASGTALWTIIPLAATAIGSLFFLLYAHAGEPTHPMSAHEDDVTILQVRVEGIATDVENNKFVLEEVKDDLKSMQVEQRASTETILRAIQEIR